MAIKFEDAPCPKPQKSRSSAAAADQSKAKTVKKAKASKALAEAAERTSSPSKFDRKAYQRELMRKRRAAAKKGA